MPKNRGQSDRAGPRRESSLRGLLRSKRAHGRASYSRQKQNVINDAAEYYMDRRITLAGMAASEIEIRSMEPHDWVEVRRIYLEGIATGNATFETEAPSWEKGDRWRDVVLLERRSKIVGVHA